MLHVLFTTFCFTDDEFQVTPKETDNEKRISYNTREETPQDNFSIVKITLYLFTIFIQSISFNIYQMFVVEYVSQTIPDVTLEQSAFVLSGSGITSIVGRLLIGGLCTLRPEMTILVKASALCLCGILSFAIIICRAYLTMFVTVCFQGLVIGGYHKATIIQIIRRTHLFMCAAMCFRGSHKISTLIE